MLAITLNGCAYFKNRGDDAREMFDFGVTVTTKWTPDFALYLDFFNMLPFGYAHIDGKIIGMCHGQFGLLNYEEKSWGLLLWGSEKRGADFDPLDINQARKDQRELTTRPRFDAGYLSIKHGYQPPPGWHHIGCQRGFHYGWLGFHLSQRLHEVADFFAGLLMGVDLLDDDSH